MHKTDDTMSNEKVKKKKLKIKIKNIRAINLFAQ